MALLPLKGPFNPLVIEILSEPPRREKLRHVNTLSDVVRLIRGATNVIVLTGAGVSVSCGIPDFRSRDGIYARLAVDFPDLPDPQAMFDIHYFRRDPRPFFKFAREIYPGQFKPSPCHRFIRMLERQGKLLRNYTQNIDTLEQQAGIENVIQCHGSFATASCQRCRYRVPAEEIREDIFQQRIPACPRCPASASVVSIASGNDRPPSIMKPDIVFFGEGLPDEFHRSMELDRERCDLLIIIGSSLKVRPVALIPSECWVRIQAVAGFFFLVLYPKHDFPF
ncbi:NAD-dependent protein deacetylase sirtuin-1 [Amphibalanus amphitrite]|uniref:protein acetyllysine N-acetyltransferase n=1 Tax=Amphibalanus amphitrite TaxID=1232801 RepID=A0A6A4WGM9_AMPAM|nr:NAD-dependent protein deacetylase sirtuin-1 [Amphibalanus amphitrite]